MKERQLHIRVDAVRYARLTMAAGWVGLTVSELIRLALDEVVGKIQRTGSWKPDVVYEKEGNGPKSGPRRACDEPPKG